MRLRGSSLVVIGDVISNPRSDFRLPDDGCQNEIHSAGDGKLRHFDKFVSQLRVYIRRETVGGDGLGKILLALGILSVDFGPGRHDKYSFIVAKQIGGSADISGRLRPDQIPVANEFRNTPFEKDRKSVV